MLSSLAQEATSLFCCTSEGAGQRSASQPISQSRQVHEALIVSGLHHQKHPMLPRESCAGNTGTLTASPRPGVSLSDTQPFSTAFTIQETSSLVSQWPELWPTLGLRDSALKTTELEPTASHENGTLLLPAVLYLMAFVFQSSWMRILPNVPVVEDSTDFFKSGAASVDVVR